MANTIKEYTAGVNADGTTYDITSGSLFTTPNYLQGRGGEDIQVRVNGNLKVLDVDYTFVNSGAIAFVDGRLPLEGDTVNITRNSNQDSRLTDYANGSLLKAEVLDADANQIFNMAQEALDKAEATRVGKETFYYKQNTPPTDIVSGTLWFDTGSSPNSLMVYNGEQWHHTAPIVDEKTYTTASSEYISHTAATATTVAYDWFELPIMTAEREVYINGIKIHGKLHPFGANDVDAWNNGEIDYITTQDPNFVSAGNEGTHEAVLIAGEMGTDDRVTVKTSHGGYATTVTESEANVKAMEANVIATAATATELASNYADSDENVSFDVDGTPTYSAKHYAAKSEQHENSVNSLAVTFSSLASQETANYNANVVAKTNELEQLTEDNKDEIEAQGDNHKDALDEHYVELGVNLNQVNYAVDSGVQNINNLNSSNVLFAEGDVDEPFYYQGVSHYSAKHYAQKAADAANVSIDKLSGWTVVDSETITTQGVADPEIVSTSSFSITAPEGVKVNDASLPIYAGAVDIGDGTWKGSPDITVTVENPNQYKLSFPSAYSSASDYQVMATYSNGGVGVVNITKNTDSILLDVRLTTSTGTRLTGGEVALTVYKFT